jgi:hypothetical protein
MVYNPSWRWYVYFNLLSYKQINVSGVSSRISDIKPPILILLGPINLHEFDGIISMGDLTYLKSLSSPK